ncbi:hypothetical protein JC525_09200 [Alteromonas sp. IB21]|uniref:hypothetical protein n=1 Tax=Alteromonas sp. IB21 TaxID=2779369 RepID=UPI0018E71EBD|nr:hypothetical protein [Alteromonas sp. IB21]MBJ2129113.1 hypothetical protein [Alteromonas sp. IB21]
MSNINWDLAPEGAEELVQYGNRLTWRKGIKIWCFVQEKWCDYVSNWQTIATREPEQPRKTVEDAVEALGGKWSEPEDCVCVWNMKSHNFELWISDYIPVNYCYQVCTYKEFEACVAAKAKSEPEWTHTYCDYGVHKDCVIIHDKPDDYGFVLVLNRRGEYVLTGDLEEKPIKPTISAKEYDLLAEYAAHLNVSAVEFDEYMSKYEVVE